MNGLATLFGSAVVVTLSCVPTEAQAPAGGVRPDQFSTRVAAVLSGSIEGNVQDETGRPLAGATVSAVGATSALALTDTLGRYRLRSLPQGAYMLRAHLSGFLVSRREIVKVRPGAPVRFSATLRSVGLSEPRRAIDPSRILAAGLGAAGAFESARRASPRTEDEAVVTVASNQTEVAWRLRHLKRSVLKDTTDRMTLVETGASGPAGAPALPGRGSWLGSLGFAGRAASFVAGLPLSGEIKILASSSASDADGSAFSPEAVGRSAAYFTVTAPTWRDADVSARALLTDGGSSSWFLATALRQRGTRVHQFDAGFSYSVKSFGLTASGPLGVQQVGSRSALSVYGVDRWRLSPKVLVDYGAHFARYGYLGGPGLFSPRLSVTLRPVASLRIKTLVSQRHLAPGSEEFLEPLAVGLWVPPGRTFVDASRGGDLEAERSRHYEVSVQQDLSRSASFQLRTFFQTVRSQQSALFGEGASFATPVEFGHYLVATSGDLEARGWSVGFTNTMVPWVRGAVSYEVTSYDWARQPDAVATPEWAIYAANGPARRLHDLTTSVETDIPFTATHLFVLYKVNSGFARVAPETGGLDGRFDLQLTQRLPFMSFTSADWQLLVAVRNLFRENRLDGSVFDELLVIRPPKRVVGGVLVRF